MTFSNIKSRNVENTEKISPRKQNVCIREGNFPQFPQQNPKTWSKEADDLYFFNSFVSTLNKYAKNKESAERDKSTWVHIRTAMIMWNSFFPSFLLYVFKPFISRSVGWYLSFARLSTWSHSTHEILRRGKHCENFLYQFYSKILDGKKINEKKFKSN